VPRIAQLREALLAADMEVTDEDVAEMIQEFDPSGTGEIR
jgi:Ca2+-binding EF-hand superfamily protein